MLLTHIPRDSAFGLIDILVHIDFCYIASELVIIDKYIFCFAGNVYDRVLMLRGCKNVI